MATSVIPRGPEWTVSRVIRLIKEYGERPALWNPECNDHKDRIKKQQDWAELAAIFKCNKFEVERKMKILNSQYRRERHKAMKLKKAGVPHRITWYAYKSFAFLNKISKKNKNIDDDSIKEEPLNDEQSPAEEEASYFYDDNIESNSQSSDLLCSNNSGSNINHEEILKTENGIEYAPTENVGPEVPERDEWAIFGELIAHGLRKLANERTRCIAKYKINTILYEAELVTFKE